MYLKDILSSWLRRTFPKRTLGQRGEAAAAKYLRKQGYKIIALGDRLKRRDELDIVAYRGKTIVFVEVKTRASADAGHPAEAVDAAKQRRLTKLAVTFLKRHGLLDYSARFDVIAITWPDGRKGPKSSTSKTPSKPPASGSSFPENRMVTIRAGQFIAWFIARFRNRLRFGAGTRLGIGKIYSIPSSSNCAAKILYAAASKSTKRTSSGLPCSLRKSIAVERAIRAARSIG